MKKIKMSLCAALMAMTLTSTVAVAPAHALISLIPGAGAVLVIGEIVCGGFYAGYLGSDVAQIADGFAPPNQTELTLDHIVAGLGIAGVVLLNEQGNPTPDLSMPTQAQAQEFGLSSDELASLQNELPQVNAINENNTASAQAMAAKGATQAEVQSFVASAWQNDSALLAPATISAVSKILGQK